MAFKDHEFPDLPWGVRVRRNKWIPTTETDGVITVSLSDARPRTALFERFHHYRIGAETLRFALRSDANDQPYANRRIANAQLVLDQDQEPRNANVEIMPELVKRKVSNATSTPFDRIPPVVALRTTEDGQQQVSFMTDAAYVYYLVEQREAQTAA